MNFYAYLSRLSHFQILIARNKSKIKKNLTVLDRMITKCQKH